MTTKSRFQLASTALFLLSLSGIARAASYDQCIFALNPSSSGALSMSGSVVVHAPACGVVVDSSSSSAFKISGSAKLTAKYVNLVGGESISGSATVSPAPQTISSQPDPLKFLVPPVSTKCDYTNFRITGSGSSTLNPGTYCNGIGISGSATVAFNSGTYILMGGGFDVSGSARLTGSAVTFFLSQNSTYSYAPLSVSGSAKLTFTAPAAVSSPYYGILFYQDPAIGTGKAASSVGGAVDSMVEGVFYFPKTGLTYSGSSHSGNYLILVADTLTLTGSADINGSFPNSRSPLEPPVSVTLSPTSALLYPGRTQQFTPTVNFSSQGVTWTLVPAGAGTISAAGLYTAPSTITTQQSVAVTATSQEDPTKSASATITLSPPISVLVAPATATLYSSQTKQFSASVVYTTNTAVTWTLGPGGTGTVTAAGLYTAPASVTTQQTVSVIATSQADPTKSASATVTLSPPVAVSVAPTTASVQAGQTQQFLQSVINTSNTAVTWTANPASGAGTVSTSGLYTPPAVIPTQQNVMVIATSQADTTKSASATVTLVPLSIVVAPTSPILFVGQTQQFTATVTKTNNTAVIWSLNPAGVGTITTNGLYTAPATEASQRTVTIIATSQADPTKSASAMVALPAVSVSVDPQTATLYAAQTQRFNASVTNAANTAVTWSITPSTAGAIDVNGLYTAPSVIASTQTVTIKATSQADGTMSGTASVTLIPVSVTVVPTSATLSATQTQQFTASVINTNNTVVNWTINPAGTGTITSTGLYTAPSTVTSQQSVTVVATSQSDNTTAASAAVTLLPSATISITPQTVNLSASQTQQFAATLPNNTSATWSISPAGAGTISSAGLYTAPNCITVAQVVTVTATGATDATKSISATVNLLNANGYSFQRALTIDSSRVPSDQANFPLSISGTFSYLATVANGGKVRNANGFDIIFTSDSAGINRLDHQIESYNPATGQLQAWVRIPVLSASANTIVYMFYGNSSVAASQENKTGVWDSAYKGVYHLGNAASAIQDSTGNGNNGTANNIASAAGQTGGAGGFNGSDSYLRIPSAAFGSNSANYAVSFQAWFKSQSGGILLGQTDGTNPPTAPAGDGWDALLAVDSSGNLYATGIFEGGDGPSRGRYVRCCLNDNAWHFVAYTYSAASGNQLKVYVDGQNVFTASVSPLGFSSAPAFAYFVGAGFSLPPPPPPMAGIQAWDSEALTTPSAPPAQWTYFNGTLDEVKVSNVVRSKDWFTADYNSQNSQTTFAAISPENNVGVQVSPAAASLFPLLTQQFQAVVTGACGQTGQAVTWSVTPVGAGTINSAGLYTAPANIPAPQSVTVTARSVTAVNAFGLATVSLQPAVSVSITPQSVTLTGGQAQQFAATVTNTTNPSVLWSINPAGMGSIDANGNYIAPASIPSPQSVTVTATSQVDPLVSASATVSLINGSSFTYHRAIEIDHTKVPNTDQTSFPVLISGTYSFLANLANGGRVQNPNGYDIIFTSDCLGVNKLSHEIESYNPATGELVAWVNIPMLSHSVDTVIYLSYGNTQVTTTSENSTGVWDSNFFGVFHLGKSGGAPSVVNSTAPNGFNRNNSATPVSGIIDGAAAFANRANIFATPQLPLSHNLTVSTWFNTSIHQTGSNPRLVDENVANLSLSGANVAFSLTSLNQNNSTQLAGVVGTGSGALDGNWHYAVGTYDGSTVKLYLDGQLNASGAAANVLPGNSFVFGVTLGTGAFISPIQTSYIGNLDESRVSSNARSADWIATEYNNQKTPSTFYTIFPENTSSVNITPSGTLGLYASQTQQFQAFVLGNCSGAPVTWTMSPAGAGSINSAGLYTGPANISAIQSVTITATSQALSTLSASVTVTLLPPASVSVAPSTAILSNSQTLQFAAAVSNAVITGVTWSLNPAGAGTISSTGLYTAPANINTQQTVTLTAVSLADPTKSASVTITLTPSQGVQVSGGTFAPVLSLIAQSLCRRPHVGPAIRLTPDQYVNCGLSGSACSATTTVMGTVVGYTVNAGGSLTYAWSLQSGPAPVQFSSPAAASTQVTFTATGAYALQLSVNDGITASIAVTHVNVDFINNSGAFLYLTPTALGPAATGTPIALQLKFFQFGGSGVINLQNATLQVTVSGVNPRTATVVTDSNGSATFSYVGQNPGLDTVTAASAHDNSNSVPITWISAPPQLTATAATARFFTADGSGVFNTPPTQQPVFTQVFPNIDFNPAPGAVPNNTSGVSKLTRPFTDVVTDSAGNFAGTIAAQGGNFQAGTGTLFNFSAVFTGSLNVPGPGPITFTFNSDDAFIFGVGNGATRVSGAQTNTPATTPFQGYPVMGGVNQRAATAASSITVNFPGAGFYVYEVDYAKGGDKNLTLTMLSGGMPIPAATLLTLTPSVLPSAQAGQVQSLQMAATGTDGVALPGLQVTVNVAGVNAQAQQLTTDGTGQVTFAYVGSPSAIGTDQIQATSTVNGAAVYSNVVTANWNSGANQPPVVSAGSPQTITLPASAVLNGTVADDGLPNNTLNITWSMLSGPGAVTFDNANQAVTAAAFSAPGSYVLQLSATDGALTANSTVTITVNASTGWATGWLASPLDNSTVTAPTPITLIPGITLTSGTLTIYPASNQIPITVLATNITGAGQIGTLDPSTLNNGAYFLALHATNSQGVTQDSVVEVHLAGDYKPGRVTATITDLTVPSPGLPIRIQRTYDSLVRGTSGDFGYGWNLGISVQVDVSPTADVTLTINGRRRTFYFTPPPNGAFTFYYTPQYTPEPGLYGSLLTTGDNCSGVLIHIGQIWECAINNAGSLYQPSGYQYTDPGGRVYTMGADGSIQSVRDLNGNTLTVTPNGISSSSGLSVPFVRDSLGRITKITDPLGNQYLYSYDANRNLASVTYPGITTPTQYQYDITHLLTQETDRRGNIAGSSTYYADGKLKSVTDAAGNTTQYAYDTAANKTTVTNPDGGTVVTVADAYGRPITVTDPLGRTTTNTYDSNHNRLTATDPLNETTTYTYDSNGFRTSKKDPLGNTSTAVYNSFGGPTSLKDPLGNTATGVYNSQSRPTQITDSLGQVAAATYDAMGNVTRFTDAAGSASTSTYDAQGNVLTVTDPLGRVTTKTYDPLGNALSTRDPRGNTFQFVYDTLGNLTQTTDPAGKITTYTYDANGNRTAVTDPLQHRTTYTYDTANRLTQSMYPDNTTIDTTYDWRRNVLTQTDQAGHVTKYVYDLAGQLTSLTAAYGTADAATVSYTYDAAGRKLTDTDARGKVTAYSYDAAGRLLTITASPAVTSFTWDADGRRTSITDPNNHTTQYAYDARGRQFKTTYPDGTTSQATYDGYGLRLTQTDQGGKTTILSYDAAKQLGSVTDAMQAAMQYGYDASGNPTTSTDANQHTTTDAYDAVNRLLTRTYPAGGSAQSNTYDSNGNLISAIDFNGKTTTFSYDVADRLLSITPDASLTDTAVTFTYTATGQRANMTDASGTTTYTYDNLDRLIGKNTPQGTLTYTYDGNSNLSSMQSSNANGASVTYGYDALNRLQSVTDNRLPAGQNTTTYSYDSAGNLAMATYPNGVQQTLTYDSLNRMTQNTAVSRSYSYGRAATGHIQSITEGSGRSATYSYDNVWRLTNETIAGDASGRNGVLSYSPDAVGNRLSLNSTLSGISSQTFTFNANDQTTGETYDANGNLLASGANNYGWDFENRLKSFNGGAAAMIYDGDDNRVAKIAGSSTTRYLLDDLNPTGYAQVVEELSGGTVQRVYTYGLQRISQLQMVNNTLTPSWYVYDGEGHVRGLANASGSITDTYDYDAFGNRINSSGTTPNVYLYRGEQCDADLNLYYLRARWYNPATGRFLSRDPMDAGNKYTYAAADPVNRTDPSGMLVAEAALEDQLSVVAAESPAFTPTLIAGGSLAGTSASVYAYTFAGAAFICILKTATDAVLKSNGIVDQFFDLPIGFETYGCRVPIPTKKRPPDPDPDPKPRPGPHPRPNPNPNPDNKDLNAMRVQLQKSGPGVRARDAHIGAVPVSNTSDPGVTAGQMQAALFVLFRQTRAKVPGSLQSAFVGAIARTSIWLGQQPPIGVCLGGNVHRETFTDRGITYRVDTENLRGCNLRQ